MKWWCLAWVPHQENATFSLVTHLFSHFPCPKMCVIWAKTTSAAFIDICLCLLTFLAIGEINERKGRSAPGSIESSINYTC